MDHILRLSEVLYLGLCCKIGTPTEVTIRRDVMDMKDMMEQIYHTGKHGCRGRIMLSGSHREGFRFKSSDQDYMIWFCERYLLNDISQLRDYASSDLVILLMEDTDTPPGFVRLQLLTQPKYFSSSVTIFRLNDRNYISSFLWRQLFLTEDSNMDYQNVHENGPCCTGYMGMEEVDRAFCFTCKYWPPSTKCWMERCLRHMWPPASVLKDILNNSYHCVAIGSKFTTIGHFLDWRLSFSLAEQKLVYTMNHTQFICYGLLKIFLKEVINDNVEGPLLCSYFMKTTMFWLIQVGDLRWCPNNILECFWKCFKYLILCVYRGKFANFFIPENNMFSDKVVGVARESLLRQLYQYYTRGVSCLLLSPTLRSILEQALSRPYTIHFTGAICQEIGCACKDLCRKNELRDIVVAKIYCFSFLKSVETLLNSSLSPYHYLTLQWCTADSLALATFMIVNNPSHSKHKHMYNLDKMLCNMLKLSSRIGSISHLVYLAMYFHRTGRYNKALYITNLTKQRLSKPFILYYRKPVDRKRYSEEINNLSLSRKMKVAWVVDIKLYHGIHYIEELILEHEESMVQSIGSEGSSYPVFVFVEMMFVLSHCRLGNRSQYLQSLTNLHTLLLYDDGTYVPLVYRSISWHILGICLQVVGDLHGALQSYQESLRQVPRSGIQKATKTRIDHIRHQLSRN